MKDVIGRFLMNWRLRKVLPLVTGRLLDIGCRTNELVHRYKGQGCGVDVFEWGDVDLVVPNTANLPFEAGHFQTVTIIAALNHIPNREEVLAEAYRVLSHDGRIILTMIPPWISKVWHLFRRHWDADQAQRGMAKGEVWGLTGSQIRILLDKVGFTIKQKKRFMLGINLLLVAEKTPSTSVL